MEVNNIRESLVDTLEKQSAELTALRAENARLREAVKHSLDMLIVISDTTDTFCEICETHARKQTSNGVDWNGKVYPINHKEDCVIGQNEKLLAALESTNA